MQDSSEILPSAPASDVCVYPCVCYFWLGLRPSSIYQVTRRKWDVGTEVVSGVGSGRPRLLACVWRFQRSVLCLRVSPVVDRIGNLCVRSGAGLRPSTPHCCCLRIRLNHTYPTSLITSPRLTTSSTYLTLFHHPVSTTGSQPHHHHSRVPKMSEQEKSSSSGEGEQAKKITMEQLQAHDKTGDLWLLMDGKGGYLHQSVSLCQRNPELLGCALLIRQEGNDGRAGSCYRDGLRSLSIADVVMPCQCLRCPQSTTYRSSWMNTQVVTRSW